MKAKRLGREFCWVALGQGAGAVGAVVGIRLLTGMLSPSSYGELTLGLTLAMLTQQAVLAPLAQSGLRFFSAAHEANQLRAYFLALRLVALRSTAVVVVLGGLLGAGLFLTGRIAELRLVAPAILLSLLSGYSSALDGMQNAARQRVVVAWHDGLTQWLRFLTAVGFVRVLGRTSAAAMLGYAAASFLVLASQGLFFRARLLSLTAHDSGDGSPEVRNWAARIQEYAWPFSVWGLFTWLQLSSDRWGLRTFDTTGSVGLYASLYQVGCYPSNLLCGAVVQLVSPVLFSMVGDGGDPARLEASRRWNARLVVGAVLLTLCAALLASLLHRQLFALVLGPAFRGVSGMLPWTVLSGGLFAAGQLASQSVLAGGGSREMIAPKLVTALLGLMLNFLGAYLWGVTGVVLAGVVFSLLYLGWVGWLGGLWSTASRRSGRGKCSTVRKVSQGGAL